MSKDLPTEERRRRSEASRRYIERHPDRYKETVRQANQKRNDVHTKWTAEWRRKLREGDPEKWEEFRKHRNKLSNSYRKRDHREAIVHYGGKCYCCGETEMIFLALDHIKSDPAVPFLVWRSYEIWVDMVLSKCKDDDIKQLKTDLAKEISDLVEQDVKDQIPEQLMRALQWRSGETLAEVKEAVIEAKKRGQKPRLRGRESCLFLEVGGTEHNPQVCVQI